MDALRPSRQPGRTLWGRLRWIVVLELVVVLLGVAAYPVDRGDFGVPGVALALAILLAGTALTAILLQPLSRVIGRPFELFFGAEGLLGRADLGRDRARTGLTVGALIIALSAVVTLGVVANSAGATADRWVSSVLPGRYAIPLQPPDGHRHTSQELGATTGTAAVTPGTDFPALIQQGTGSPREASVAGIDPTVFSATGSLIFTSGDRDEAFAALDEGGRSSSRSRSRGATTSVSDPPCSSPSRPPTRPHLHRRRDHRLQPAGAVRRRALSIGCGDAREALRRQRGRGLGIREAAGRHRCGLPVGAADAGRRLCGRAAHRIGTLQRPRALLDRVIGLFDVLALLAVVIAALGIVNTLAVSVVERAREIAILRSHGMTTGQVQAMVVAGRRSWARSAGWPHRHQVLMSWAVVGGTASQDFGAGLAIPWPLLISVVLLGTGVAALAGLYPARLAGRIPIVRTIARHGGAEAGRWLGSSGRPARPHLGGAPRHRGRPGGGDRAFQRRARRACGVGERARRRQAGIIRLLRAGRAPLPGAGEHRAPRDRQLRGQYLDP